jgi:hypothetical protein
VVEQIVVRARLLAATPPPKPESIAPYRRALLVNDYEVESVTKGTLNEKKFLAAQWGVLDAKVLPQKWQIGTVYQLTLEKFADQPQLEGERLVSESDNFDLNLYYVVDVAEPAAKPDSKR